MRREVARLLMDRYCVPYTKSELQLRYLKEEMYRAIRRYQEYRKELKK
jgi:hypothetical protein